MKFVCLHYMDESYWAEMPKSERAAMMEECRTFDNELRRNGHFLGSEALGPSRNGVTLTYQNGRVSVSEGPLTKTKNLLSGILLLEARDLEQAIELMSKHPAVQHGILDIRHSDQAVNALIAERDRKVRQEAASDGGTSVRDGIRGKKFVCLGYLDESQWAALPQGEQAAIMEECFVYDDELRRGGHFVGGEALECRNGATLRHQAGRVVITDGPFAETKEQLGGILLMAARDLNHAIQLMTKHPGVRCGPFEIRPPMEMKGKG